MAKLLLFEDAELVAEALKTSLQRRGHEIERVGELDEGLCRLKTYRYDLGCEVDKSRTFRP